MDLHTMTHMLQSLAEESQADGAILLLNVGGQVLYASIGKLDFTQSLAAFSQACRDATA